jgi:cobalt-zinc-cadmium efflux system membrane fusion protein
VKFIWFLIPALALLPAGCSHKGGQEQTSVVSAAAPPAQTTAGQVTLPADSPKLKQLKIEAVETAEVPVDEVNSPGKVEINPNRVSRVTLPVAGRVTRVYVRIGDTVTQGQPLLEVESPDLDAAASSYLQAQAQLNQGKSVLAKANADVDRVRDLYAHQAIAQKEVLNAESMQTQAKATVEQSEALVQQAARRMEIFNLKPGQFGQRLTVNAPVSGKVLEMNIVPGEFKNDLAAPLITIADLSTVWVSSDVQESQIRLIQKGEPVEVEFAAYPNEKFRGRVAQIADIVDPQTRTIKVRAELLNPAGRFRPDMFCRIRHVEGLTLRPVVPSAAVMQSDGSNAVFREISTGVFQHTAVKLGAPTGDRIAVVSGVKPGDRIVTDGVMLLRTY